MTQQVAGRPGVLGQAVVPLIVADRHAGARPDLAVDLERDRLVVAELVQGGLHGGGQGDRLPVREVRLSAGAGFVVVICGEIMTMPGLPRVPSAEAIMLNEAGEIEGLF